MNAALLFSPCHPSEARAPLQRELFAQLSMASLVAKIYVETSRQNANHVTPRDHLRLRLQLLFCKLGMNHSGEAMGSNNQRRKSARKEDSQLSYRQHNLRSKSRRLIHLHLSVSFRSRWHPTLSLASGSLPFH